MNTFLVNIRQLIAENLPEAARRAAEGTITTRIDHLINRLKGDRNYHGQAGQNLYEDVSCLFHTRDSALHSKQRETA